MSKKTSTQGGNDSSAHKALIPERTPDKNWRDTKTCEQVLKHFCLSEHLSDIRFKFKSDQHVSLPAHKFVLSMRSAVFEAMCYGTLAEKDIILIKDVDPETMKVVLRFVYFDNTGLNGNNVLSCLYAAEKYDLPGLKKKCIKFLENNMDTDDVCVVLEHAIACNLENLKKTCFEYILENASDVFSSEGFLKVSHPTLLDLLKQDKLSIEEMGVFVAAIRWAENYCKAKQLSTDAKNLRKSLGEAVFEIRFPIMSIEDFATVVKPSGILTSEEQIMVYEFNAKKGSSPIGKFINRERSGTVITVALDTTTYTKSQDEAPGSVLQVQCRSSVNPDYEDKYVSTASAIPTTRTSLKIKYITRKFVKNISTIMVGNNHAHFSAARKEITFKNPLKYQPGL